MVQKKSYYHSKRKIPKWKARKINKLPFRKLRSIFNGKDINRIYLWDCKLSKWMVIEGRFVPFKTHNRILKGKGRRTSTIHIGKSYFEW